MIQLEGNGASRLIQLMKQNGKNVDVSIAIGTVTVPPPSLAIRLEGDKFDLDDELIAADHLLDHKRIATIKCSTIDGTTKDAAGHTHAIESLTLNDAEIDVKTNLKVGDQVIVAVAQDSQLYYVLAKA